MHRIDKMISELPIDELRTKISTGEIEPRNYQWLCYALASNEIRRYMGPFYITASVGAGKTIMIAMLARRFSDMGYEGMVLARQSEIISQNAEECWNFGTPKIGRASCRERV